MNWEFSLQATNMYVIKNYLQYADQIIKEIDPLQLVKYKFYKHDCISDNGSFIKDLKILNKEMS